MKSGGALQRYRHNMKMVKNVTDRHRKRHIFLLTDLKAVDRETGTLWRPTLEKASCEL